MVPYMGGFSSRMLTEIGTLLHRVMQITCVASVPIPLGTAILYCGGDNGHYVSISTTLDTDPLPHIYPMGLWANRSRQCSTLLCRPGKKLHSSSSA